MSHARTPPRGSQAPDPRWIFCRPPTPQSESKANLPGMSTVLLRGSVLRACLFMRLNCADPWWFSRYQRVDVCDGG